MTAEELIEYGRRLERERNKYRFWLAFLIATWLLASLAMWVSTVRLNNFSGELKNLREHVHVLTDTVAAMKERIK